MSEQPLTEQPLTDEEIAAIERVAWMWAEDDPLSYAGKMAAHTLRLVGDLRRARAENAELTRLLAVIRPGDSDAMSPAESLGAQFNRLKGAFNALKEQGQANMDEWTKRLESTAASFRVGQLVRRTGHPGLYRIVDLREKVGLAVIEEIVDSVRTPQQTVPLVSLVALEG